MNQLEAIIESARTGRSYRSAGGGLVHRVRDGVLEYSAGGVNGRWHRVHPASLNMCAEVDMLDSYSLWLESLSAEDREAVEMSQREVRAWEACAWMANHLDSEFFANGRHFSLGRDGTFYDNGMPSLSRAHSYGFRLILRPDLAAKLKEFGK